MITIFTSYSISITVFRSNKYYPTIENGFQKVNYENKEEMFLPDVGCIIPSSLQRTDKQVDFPERLNPRQIIFAVIVGGLSFTQQIIL